MISTQWMKVAVAACALGLAACDNTTNGTTDGGTTGLNNCADSAFTTAGASPTITFGVNGLTYSPPCLLVSANTTVTFSGTFSMHPLTPGVAPNASGTSSPGNPIPATSSGSSVAVKFTTPGSYPYYCAIHFGSGMMGAIKVQ